MTYFAFGTALNSSFSHFIFIFTNLYFETDTWCFDRFVAQVTLTGHIVREVSLASVLKENS
jgi:hypothetical protein